MLLNKFLKVRAPLQAHLEHEVEVRDAVAHGQHLAQHVLGDVVRQVRHHSDVRRLARGAALQRGRLSASASEHNEQFTAIDEISWR